VTPNVGGWDGTENSDRSHNAQRKQRPTQDAGVLKSDDI